MLQISKVLGEGQELKEACNCHNGKFRNTMNYHQVNYTFDEWSDPSFVENIFMIHVFKVYLQN